jgi:hypothetical protein
MAHCLVLTGHSFRSCLGYREDAVNPGAGRSSSTFSQRQGRPRIALLDARLQSWQPLGRAFTLRLDESARAAVNEAEEQLVSILTSFIAPVLRPNLPRLTTRPRRLHSLKSEKYNHTLTHPALRRHLDAMASPSVPSLIMPAVKSSSTPVPHSRLSSFNRGKWGVGLFRCWSRFMPIDICRRKHVQPD